MTNLRSFSELELKDIVISAIAKQFEISKDTVNLEDNITKKFDADSVDLVGVLLVFENLFENSSKIKFQLPTNKINEVITVNDLYNLLKTTLVEIESKLNSNELIKPNLNILL